MSSNEGPPDKIRLTFIFLGTLSFALGLYSFQSSEVTDEFEETFYILCGVDVLATIVFLCVPILISNKRVKLGWTILDSLYNLGYGIALISVSSIYIIMTKELESNTCRDIVPLIKCQEYTLKISAAAVAIINGILHLPLALGLLLSLCGESKSPEVLDDT